MDLSLADAARALGKSERQVRYLIKTGKLDARKAEGHWVIADSALPLTDGQRRARARKADALADAVQEALGPHLRPPGRKVYSMREIAAFQAASPLLLEIAGRLGAEHVAVVALRKALVRIGQGCHRFHQRDKAAAYYEAREEAAAAAVHLYLAGEAASAERLEQDVLPAIAGVLRRNEPRAGG